MRNFLMIGVGLLGCLSPSFSFAAGETIAEGRVTGRNSARWISKACSIEVYRHQEQLNVIVINDSAKSYNIWLEGEELRPAFSGKKGWLHSGAVSFESRNLQSGIDIYSNRPTNKSARQAYSLDIEAGDNGKILRFMFHHFDEQVRHNTIECEMGT